MRHVFIGIEKESDEVIRAPLSVRVMGPEEMRKLKQVGLLDINALEAHIAGVVALVEKNLHQAMHKIIYEIKTEAFHEGCKTCGGKGGITYYFAHDDARSVDCPDCNNGDRKSWDDMAEQWKKHNEAEDW
jgi:hypothetical protein